jgi:hypothetical protein
VKVKASRLIVASIVMAVGVPGGAAASASAASGSQPVLVYANCVKPAAKPHSYILTCADAGIQVTHATYSAAGSDRWGSSLVEGKGTYVYNDCTPNCAAGHFHHHPVTFTLSRIRVVNGHRLYTRLQATYAGLSEVFSLPTRGV